jgi:hypothetical protein
MVKTRKKQKIQPTANQKKVALNVMEMVKKGEPIAISKAMRGVYSPATAKHPEKITKSKGWQELMKKFLPDTLLAKRHTELLNKRETYILKTEDGIERIDLGPETQAVSKGLDMAYLLKGYYAPTKTNNTVMFAGIIGFLYDQD